MEIKQVKISEITPYAANTKKHDQTQIDNVAESIRKFGFVQPLVIDRDGVVVIGHCRLLAAQKLGMDEVPCVRVDDLTDKQVKALRIIDNKTNESPWDMDLLELELPDIDDIMADFDLDFGMSEEDYSPDDFGDEFSLPDGEKPEICQMTFTLHSEQKEKIESAIETCKHNCRETFGNTNENGNALYEVIMQWEDARK